jgi:hypothetical protein
MPLRWPRHWSRWPPGYLLGNGRRQGHGCLIQGSASTRPAGPLPAQPVGTKTAVTSGRPPARSSPRTGCGRPSPCAPASAMGPAFSPSTNLSPLRPGRNCANARAPPSSAHGRPWAGFTENWEQTRREQQERREAKKQAEHAVRDAAYGKTREELRDLYIAEFRARGLDLPPRGLPRGGDRLDDRPSAARALEAVAAHFLRHLTARSPEHNSRGTRQQAAAASGRESKRLQRPVRPA